jgi:dipeptidyl aminopeptidase/acylaminoacyl peptidase
MKRLLVLASLVSIVACGGAEWRPPPAEVIPIPPPPKDSIEREGGDEFDDDESEGQSGLIPRRLLFGNPDRASPALSPDGRRLALLAPEEGVLNVWVAPVDDVAAAKAVTHDRKRGVRNLFWAHDNRHILYLQDKGGDENWRVYSVDLESGKERDLTPFEGVNARIEGLSHKHPGKVLVALNDRDKSHHDLYRIDIESAKRHLVHKNDENLLGFFCDDDLRLRLGVKMLADGGKEFVRLDAETPSSFATVALDDAATTGVVGFDHSGKTLFMTDSRGRNTAALTRQPLEGGPGAGRTTIWGHDKADVHDVMRHPTTGAVQAVAATFTRRTWHFVDAAVKTDFGVLADVAAGDIQVVSRSLDDRQWIVSFVADDGPVRFYAYDRADKKATFLFSNRAELEGLPLSSMRPVVLKARDGLELVSYLTLPAAEKGERPAAPLPLILYVHGGPWARDEWGLNAYHQWAQNRGYAVLSVNYRGSTGFGKAFVNAANREWAGRMHDDLIDAVEWAVKSKIARPDKIAIMGGSYGGYATLVGLTFTPERFACGVDVVGPSNLVTLLESVPPYWAPHRALFKARVGDHTTADGKADLLARSPLSRVGAIARPLLIVQGANDPRVKQAESDQIVAAMRGKGIPVTYALYPDEGHGLARPENRVSFMALSEAFLGRCLGGKKQPLARDLEGASVTVPVGVEHVPGLRDHLRR